MKAIFVILQKVVKQFTNYLQYEGIHKTSGIGFRKGASMIKKIHVEDVKKREKYLAEPFLTEEKVKRLWMA